MSDDLNHKNGHTNGDEIDEFLSQFDSEEPSMTPDEKKISEFEKITDDLSKTLNKTRIFKSDDIEKSLSEKTQAKEPEAGVTDTFLEELPVAKPSRVERLSGGRKSSREQDAEKPSSPAQEFASKPEAPETSQEDIDPLWQESMEVPKLPQLNLFKKKDQKTGKTSEEGQQGDQMASKGKKGKKKKNHRFNFKRLLVTLLLLGLILCVAGGVVVASVIISAPSINPADLYDNLPENSTVYDRNGTKLETFDSDGMRTNVYFNEMPTHLVEAFISIEDKTFWDHHGFNFVRIFGAIWESVKGADKISGTSTITQQLARNVYLTDTRFDYSFSRKIVEAYYAVELERKLSKQEIITAYLNTIYLGNQANGVQAASRNYFDKDVWDLNLAESALLAALAQSPNRFAPMKKDVPENLEDLEEDLIIHEDAYYIYYYNDGYRNRQLMVLGFMLDQDKITQAEYDEAVAYDIKGALSANQFKTTSLSSYFVDYAKDQVVADLMAALDIDKEEATDRLYSRGYQIHTTLDADMQSMVEGIFAESSNFPGATALNRDSEGNIRSKNNQILLYSATSYFASFTNETEEKFLMRPDEYTFNADNSLTLYKGKRLNFKTNMDIEFKPLYYYDAGNVLNTMDGGVIHVASEYKDWDENGNMVIKAEFFQNVSGLFYVDEESQSLVVPTGTYTFRAAVMQPQAAMVIIDHQTGEINAMVGGRSLSGRLLYNRATKPRQPGSSIKPIAVYAAALEASAVEGYANIEGKYWTAATGVEDSPLSQGGSSWPKNWYSGYRGMQTVRTAIEQSTNTVAVKVLNDIGPERSVAMLKKLGVSTVVEETSGANDMNPAALALGGMTYGISPLEMAGAYGAFPNGGVYKEPIAYTRITTRNGDVILEKTPNTTQAMDPGVAWIMNDMLRSTVTSGLASRAQGGISAHVAGKTGTTSDNFDAWFVGFTPQYVASVWIGNDVNIELTRGSAAATEVWNKVMRNIPSNKGTFGSAPSNVTSTLVDAVSGMLPTGYSSARNEYFVVGTVPSQYDTYNTSREVCAESGMLPTPWCVDRVMRGGSNEPEGTYWTPPTTYCPIHNENTDEYPIYVPSPEDSENQDSDDGNDGSTGNSDDGGGSTGSDGNSNSGSEIPIVDSDGSNDNDNAGSSVPDWLRVD